MAELAKAEHGKDYKEAVKDSKASKDVVARTTTPRSLDLAPQFNALTGNVEYVNPLTGEVTVYQEVANTHSTTPASERMLATPEDTLQRLLTRRLAEVLRQHGGSESSIALDHEYWHLKGLVVPPVVVVD
jgi:hypothetical protein